jgi:hypothetical protein
MRRSSFSLWCFLLLLVLACVIPCHAVEAGSGEATIGADGEVKVSKAVTDIAAKLLSAGTSLREQDALDIATLIDTAKNDKETKMMLLKMKTQEQQAFDGTANSSPAEIVKGLEQAMDELKMLDVLFRDKERALREMEKEGMIPKDKLKKYKKNPDLLEEDTRKGLYFTFVALAEAGGYM